MKDSYLSFYSPPHKKHQKNKLIFLILKKTLLIRGRLKRLQVFENKHESGLHSLKVTCLGILKKVKSKFCALYCFVTTLLNINKAYQQ